MKLSDIKANVLIVDDDVDIRSAVRMTLELETGVYYAFTEAENAAAGLKALKAAKPDVVILDLHMPGESGFDFINRLKKDNLPLLKRVIILTADNSIKNLMKADNKGVDAYHFMGKPFMSDELRALALSLVIP